MSEESSNSFHNHVQIFREIRKKIMAIKLKPDHAMFKDRLLQFLSMWLWVIVVLWIELASIILLGYIVVKGGIIGKLFGLWYATHMYNTLSSPETGANGQGSEAVRSSRWLYHFSRYFPVRCVKTAELPADKNYLFAVYPHGVISIGVFCNFCTSGTNFRELFPGIRSKVCTLNYHFFVPLYRELALAWGMISAKPNSIINALTQSNNKSAVSNYDGYTSNAVVLVVGGAEEALHARPGDYRLVLNRRKGFVRIAIQTGAALVPVFSFGEIDILGQPPNEKGSKLRAYQDFVKKWTGVVPVMFHGRGFTEKSFGLFPHRHPITTVIGKPIEVVKNPNPTRDEVNELHAKYVEGITNLFNEYKDKYVKNPEKTKLIIE